MNTDPHNPHDPHNPQTSDDATDRIARKLRQVSPAPISSELRERLLTPPTYTFTHSHRLDRALRLAFPWACAACLTVGFFTGSGWQHRTAPQTERHAPVSQNASLDPLAVGFSNDYLTPWLATEPADDDTQPNRAPDRMTEPVRPRDAYTQQI
ncbi:MAG: hypothetical protein KAS72_00580 [Phycisphaerales bacterium]|nr:hypothetical protein [Phycisphaerales bacterium]